ncbi:unnamed protein product [Closterium sp. NIES-53]
MSSRTKAGSRRSQYSPSSRSAAANAFSTRGGSSGTGGGGAAGLLDGIARERPHVVIASCAVFVLIATRFFWFPAPYLASRLVEPAGCDFAVYLNARGVLEGPWLNDTADSTDAAVAAAAAAAGLDFTSGLGAGTGVLLGDTGPNRLGGGAGSGGSGGGVGTSAGQNAGPMFFSGRRLQAMGKMVAAREGEDDGKVPWAVVVEGLLTTGAFSTSDPVTLAFARLAERFLAPWARIEGITDGLGKTGLIKAAALKAIATNPKLMTCVAQVRVVDGRVFFRYGSFLEDERKLLRINLAVKMIHEAVVTFELQTLRAELYLNACDDPHSYDNSLSSGRSGFAVLSAQWTPGVTDILFPDPLDLAYQPSYSPHAGRLGEAQQERQGLEPLPVWERRQSRAEWRGRALELVLKEANWASSLRVRLHRMSDARPDLLDARLTMWGDKDGVDAKKLLLRWGGLVEGIFRRWGRFLMGETFSLMTRISLWYSYFVSCSFPFSLPRHGVVLAEEVDDVAERRRGCKYVLVVDEQIGTRDMCRALSGPQAVIRHTSGYTEFFDPLLLPGVHYAPVGHSFRDLFSVIEWMQRNDAAVRTMVRNANELAALVCTWHSRVHFWAVLLAKYASRALENPAAVVAPTPCRGGRARICSQWANSTVSGACKVERSVDEAGVSSWSELAKAAGERGASALLEVLGIDGSVMEEMGDDNMDRCSDFCVSGVPEDRWVWLDAEESLKDVYPHDPIGRSLHLYNR